MPNTRSHRACAGRAAQTGETFQQSFEALGRLSPEAPPIPDPAGEDQAFLESRFLESIGRCDVDRWRPRMLPFSVRSVTPLPDELLVRVPLKFLPDILRQVMPFWSTDEEEDGHPEVYGIAGLRGCYERGRLILTRPGLPGRIAIPGTSSQWQAVDDC
jgi:hypothetical protein